MRMTLDGQIQGYRKELEEDMYKDAEEKYQDTMIKLRVSVSDDIYSLHQ